MKPKTIFWALCLCLSTLSAQGQINEGDLIFHTKYYQFRCEDVIVPFLGKDWLAPLYVTLDLDSELVTREVEPIVPKKPKHTISPIDSSIVYYEPPKERYIYSIHNKKGELLLRIHAYHFDQSRLDRFDLAQQMMAMFRPYEFTLNDKEIDQSKIAADLTSVIADFSPDDMVNFLQDISRKTGLILFKDGWLTFVDPNADGTVKVVGLMEFEPTPEMIEEFWKQFRWTT